jgi:hypothetical protein
MSLKIAKALLICALACSIIIATTMTTLNLCQTYTAKDDRPAFTSEGKSPRSVLVGDPLPGDGWPQGGNQTGNQTR